MTEFIKQPEILAYCKMRYWTAFESAMILSGRLPSSSSEDELRRDDGAYFLMTTIQRLVEKRRMHTPGVLFGQLNQIGIEIPNEIVSECKKYRSIYRKKKKSYSEMKLEIEELKAENQKLIQAGDLLEGKRAKTIYMIAYAAMELNVADLDQVKTNIINKISRLFEGYPQDRTLKKAIDEILSQAGVYRRKAREFPQMQKL